MHQLIFCTCPNDNTARQIATTLVEKQLVACANIIPGITSIYQWQGEITSDEEQLLILKSDAQHYPQLEAEILTLHPYELPEIVAVSMAQALPAYLNWIDSCLTSK